MCAVVTSRTDMGFMTRSWCFLVVISIVIAEEEWMLHTPGGGPLDSRCPCMSPEQCPRPFGMTEDDVHRFGQLPICVDSRQVRCCGASLRVEVSEEIPVKEIQPKSEMNNTANHQDTRQHIDNVISIIKSKLSENITPAIEKVELISDEGRKAKEVSMSDSQKNQNISDLNIRDIPPPIIIYPQEVNRNLKTLNEKDIFIIFPSSDNDFYLNKSNINATDKTDETEFSVLEVDLDGATEDDTLLMSESAQKGVLVHMNSTVKFNEKRGAEELEDEEDIPEDEVEDDDEDDDEDEDEQLGEEKDDFEDSEGLDEVSEEDREERKHYVVTERTRGKFTTTKRPNFVSKSIKQRIEELNNKNMRRFTPVHYGRPTTPSPTESSRAVRPSETGKSSTSKMRQSTTPNTPTERPNRHRTINARKGTMVSKLKESEALNMTTSTERSRAVHRRGNLRVRQAPDVEEERSTRKSSSSLSSQSADPNEKDITTAKTPVFKRNTQNTSPFHPSFGARIRGLKRPTFTSMRHIEEQEVNNGETAPEIVDLGEEEHAHDVVTHSPGRVRQRQSTTTTTTQSIGIVGPIPKEIVGFPRNPDERHKEETKHEGTLLIPPYIHTPQPFHDETNMQIVPNSESHTFSQHDQMPAFNQHVQAQVQSQANIREKQNTAGFTLTVDSQSPNSEPVASLLVQKNQPHLRATGISSNSNPTQVVHQINPNQSNRPFQIESAVHSQFIVKNGFRQNSPPITTPSQLRIPTKQLTANSIMIPIGTKPILVANEDKGVFLTPPHPNSPQAFHNTVQLSTRQPAFHSQTHFTQNGQRTPQTQFSKQPSQFVSQQAQQIVSINNQGKTLEQNKHALFQNNLGPPQKILQQNLAFPESFASSQQLQQKNKVFSNNFIPTQTRNLQQNTASSNNPANSQVRGSNQNTLPSFTHNPTISQVRGSQQNNFPLLPTSPTMSKIVNSNPHTSSFETQSLISHFRNQNQNTINTKFLPSTNPPTVFLQGDKGARSNKAPVQRPFNPPQFLVFPDDDSKDVESDATDGLTNGQQKELDAAIHAMQYEYAKQLREYYQKLQQYYNERTN